jgi:hypothetical protein
MKRKTNDMITFVGVSTSVLVVAFLESFGFITPFKQAERK